MRVLVTGGAGLIGSHVVDRLLAGGREVTVLDNLEPEVHPTGAPDWLSADVRFVQGDLRDPAALDRALEGCTGVVHLAAYGGFTPEFSKIADVNCTGTTRLFEALRRQDRVERVVAASSMAIYGEGWYACSEHGSFHGTPRPLERLERGDWEVRCPRCDAAADGAPIAESSAARPASVYAASKYFTERLTLCEGRDLGIHAAALRYFLTYGPRQSVHNPYSGICSIFATRLLNGMRPMVYEDGLQTRDMVFVEDAARATLAVFDAPEAAGRVFNVARGEGVGIAALARLLATACGRDIEPETGTSFRPMDNRHMIGDASSLHDLGWRPEVGVPEGITRYADWVRGLGAVAERFGAAERRLRASGVVRPATQPPPRRRS